jgi:hypothetical protein
MARPSPYKGLVPYEEEDAEFFFGREKETRLVVANLFAAPLTLLYGPSGVGKTSLLQAGVVRTLRGRDDVTVVSLRNWQEDPLGALKTTIAAQTPSAAEANASLARVAEVRVAESDRPLMVILDQFEEHFLYRRSDAFEDELAEAVNRLEVPASFLISIREDALAKLDVFESRMPSLFDNYLRVAHLTRRGAESAIREPLEKHNALHGSDVAIEAALVGAVVS